MPATPSMSLMTNTRISTPHSVGERGLDPGRSRSQRLLVARLEDDLDLGPVLQKAGIAPDCDGGMAARGLLEDADDLPLPSPIASSPGSDRRALKAIGERFEHGLHLARQTRQDVDVAKDEARSAAERVGDGHRA